MCAFCGSTICGFRGATFVASEVPLGGSLQETFPLRSSPAIGILATRFVALEAQVPV